MITVDTDLVYSTKHYELNIKRKNLNAYSSIDEYSDEYALEQASGVSSDDIDLNEVIKALNLQDPKNRFAILSMLNHSDLVRLLYLLGKDKLLLGLKFFTKKKLLKFIYNLPKEQMLKILFQIFNKDYLVGYMPVKELMRFLTSKKIQFNDIIKVFQGLPTHILAQIYEGATGTPAGNKSQAELISEMRRIPQEKLVDGIQSLPYKEMLDFVRKLVKQDNNLFKEFSKEMLFKPLMSCPKSTLIEGMSALDPDTIISLLGTLPDNLLAQVVTLIDSNKLASVLENEYSGLLAKLAA